MVIRHLTPRLLVALGLAAGVSAARTSGAQQAVTVPSARSAAPTDSALRAELLRLEMEDQAGREALPGVAARQDTVRMRDFLRADSLRTLRLKAIVAQRGWPTPATVGTDGVQAAWTLLQHASDYAWQESMLPTIERAGEAGSIRRADVAMLTDRVLVHAKKPQRYGTSFRVDGSRLVADSIADIEHLAERRAAAGLPPMADYARVLGQLYGMPVDWPPRAP